MFLAKCYQILKRYIPVILLSIILGTLAYLFTVNSLRTMIERSLIEIAKQGANTIENDVKNHISLLNTIANIKDINDSSIAVEDKVMLLKDVVKGNEVLAFAWIDKHGILTDTNGNSYSVADQAFFIKALSGEENLSELIDSLKYDTNIIITTVPVFFKGEIVGALSAIHPIEWLCSTVEHVSFSASGYGFLIDKNGMIIAHPNRSLVIEHFNAITESNADKSLESLASIKKEMINGKDGAGEYIYTGLNKYLGFTKINGFEWYFAATAPKSEVYDSVNNLIYMIILGIIVFVIILITVNTYLVYIKSRVSIHQNTLKAAIETANIITFALRPDGTIIYYNKNAVKQLENKNHFLKHGNLFKLLSEKDQEKLKKKILRCQAGMEEHSFELTILSEDKKHHILCSIHPYVSKKYKECYEILAVDITDRAKKEIELREKHEELSSVYEELAASEEELKSQLDELIRQKIMLQESDQRYNLVVDASDIGIWDWDVVANKTYYSDKWHEIFGFSKEDDFDTIDTWREFMEPHDREVIQKAYMQHVENKTAYYEGEFRLIKDGKIKWIHAIGKGLWDSDDKLVRMAGAHTDITSKKETEEKIFRLAYFDTLTGLANRSCLLEKFIEEQKNHRKQIALIFMDLDDFKLVNDSYGHTIGDRILIEVATRLKAICQSNMFISRLGGDEYAILVWDYDSEEALKDFVEEIMLHIDGDIKVNDYHISLSISIGIAMYPVDALDFDELLKDADTAMYKAKERRNKYVFYHKEMNDAILERLNLSNCLKGALDNHEFMVVYQPQYRVRDQKIMGFEALLRWKNQKLGMVSPVKFIPIAEESKLIIPIGKWVLRTAIAFLKKVHELGHKQLIMSINISIIQLMQKDFTVTVLEILEENEIPSELLELEITESVLMESVSSVIHNILLLRKAGVKFALDDFGTGYSSLNYLTQLPINTLKIDKSFIDNIGHIKEKSLLISTIVDIGRKLGLSIVAEGVEVQEQFDYLVRRRCDRVQGYLFSRPLPEYDVLKLIEDL